MKLLFIATEAAPYCKNGALSDIVYGLAKELCVEGHDARIVVPRYRTFACGTASTKVLDGLKVSLGAYSRVAHLWKAEGNDRPIVYFVEQNFYFGRDDYYGYADDYERFIFLTRAALEMLNSPDFRTAEKEWFPDIIQGFDWATGLIPGWLPGYRSSDHRFDAVRFVLFVHNIRRLGKFGSRALSLAQQESGGIYPAIGEDPDRVSFLGRGLMFADQVVTVNSDFSQDDNPLPGTAEVLRDILTSRLAEGGLHGIVSRVDSSDWDPATDTALSQRFTYGTLGLRAANKLALQARLNLKVNKDIPLLGVVNRLIPERGFQLLSAIEKHRAELGEIQLVVLAAPGDTDYQQAMERWEGEQDARQPWVTSRVSVDDDLARTIYAGCDIYLLPAKELPGGINQLIAMRYGALPVARHTGAIARTVCDYQPGMSLWNDVPPGMGVGFSFDAFTDEEFLHALGRALEVYRHQPAVWRQMQVHNMQARLTWDVAAADYLELYTNALALSPREIHHGEPFAGNRESRMLQSLQELGNLPYAGNLAEILGEAARLVRWVLSCDAVRVTGLAKSEYFSAADSGDRKSGSFQSGFDFAPRLQPPDAAETALLLNQSSTNTRALLGDIDLEGGCRSLQGLEDSRLARDQRWAAGWSAPVLVQGRLLGWIDALFADSPADKVWMVSSLTSLANSFGLRLDTIRLQGETRTLSAMGLDLIRTQSTYSATERACWWASELVPGSSVWVYLVSNGELVIPAAADGSELSLTKLARGAVESNRVVYLADWNDAPRGPDGRRTFRSVLAIPIAPNPVAVPGEIDAVLIVASPHQAAFARDDERVLANHLAPLISAALRKAHGAQAADQRRVSQIKSLVSSLVAGVEFDELLERVVNTIGEVLEVRAGALYLLNDQTRKLELRAAYGYQRDFLDKKISYEVGEGLTGWIAEHGEILKFNSLAELHAHPGWVGHYNRTYEVPEPNAFLGIPLVVQEGQGGASKVIGILKVEDRIEALSKAVFDEGDVHLGEMMANVIATVVYNAQLGERNLREFSTNLRDLSDVLAGSRDRDTLMQNIVDKMLEVLHVDAASLYLADDAGTELVIQAAAGYLRPLVERRVKYKWGEGVTGRIAASGKSVVARSLDELRDIGGTKSEAYDEYQGGFQPQSFYGLPLVVSQVPQAIGVLKVESTHQRFFTKEDILLIGMMANVIATVVYNTQQTERRLSDFSVSLRELSSVLVGSRDRDTLMQNIVEKIKDVLHVDAASLYLADDSGTELVIQAAAGYQKPLVERKVKYKWGQGVTGRIAASGQPVVARSLEELRAMGGAINGVYDEYHQGGTKPQSFYGLPLVVSETPQAIGVLKVESTKQRFFSNEDVLLIGMMANVIATVVYNAQQMERRLSDFSVGLAGLSGVLAGSHDMPTLMANIVEKIKDVLHVDAASLYLADDGGTELVIQAAAGYQKPLVERKVKYKWGEGVTGRIAANLTPLWAKSLEELRALGGTKRGAYDEYQGGAQPQSFYGLPLVVSQTPQAIGVLKVESTKQRFFTDEDVLLIGMMANVIATVIYNARQSEKHLGSILRHLGSLSSPVNAAADVLSDFARSQDSGVTGQLAIAVASILDRYPERIIPEAQALFAASANRAIYRQVARWAKQGQVRWSYSLFDGILDAHRGLKRWGDVMAVAEPWIALSASVGDPEAFARNASHLAGILASKIHVPSQGQGMDPSATWFGQVLGTESLFGDDIAGIPLFFQRHGEFDEGNQVRLLGFLRDELKRPYRIVVLVLWSQRATPEQIQWVRDQMSIHAVDIVVATITDILSIQESPNGADAFRKLVIRQATTPSPFIQEGPVPDSMFFGRDREIREIMQYLGSGRSCVLIGGRRIGKTSILWRLHRTRLPDAGFRTVFCGVGAVKTPEEFFSMSVANMRPDAPPNAPVTLGGLLDLAPSGEPIVLLLDEADKLVEVDRKNQWLIGSRLRAAANSGLRIVLGGERVLQHALQDVTSPMLNLGSPVILGPLEYPDVKKLITGPFGQLDIELRDPEAVVRRIYDFTSGHPNVVQRIGRHLIRRINARKVRQITVDDVKAVIEDPTFQREDFLNIYWERATTLEKIISLLMVGDSAPRTLGGVIAALAKRCSLILGAEEVDEAMRHLVQLRQILTLTPSGYEFAVSAFPRVVAGTMASSDLLLILTDRYRREHGLL